MGLISRFRYLRSFPEPLDAVGKSAPTRWAEYALPVWGACLGLAVATLDHGFGYLFQNPLISSALTVALLAGASRCMYPAYFARFREARVNSREQAQSGNEFASHVGMVFLMLLFLVKVMALNALWLTVRWPVIALVPLASRWGIVVCMNLLPYAPSSGSEAALSHRRAIGPIVSAALVFAAVPLACVYISGKGFPLGGLRLDIAARIWAATATVTLLLSARHLPGMRGWTAARTSALAEIIEVAVPLAVIMTIPR